MLTRRDPPPAALLLLGTLAVVFFLSVATTGFLVSAFLAYRFATLLSHSDTLPDALKVYSSFLHPNQRSPSSPRPSYPTELPIRSDKTPGPACAEPADRVPTELAPRAVEQSPL